MDLSSVNAKLDKIIALLTPAAPAKTKSEQIVEEIEFNSGEKIKPVKKAKKAVKKAKKTKTE